MPTVVITAARRRRWWPGEHTHTWTRNIPERWADIPNRRRRLYYRLAMRGEVGQIQIIAHLLRLPRWVMQALTAAKMRELKALIAWMEPRPDCEVAPWPYLEYRGRTWHLPRTMGESLTCIEYPLADEYYLRFVQDGDDTGLLLLVATLVREDSNDHARTLREDDARVPLHSRAEVIARAQVLRHLPLEYQMSVLMWFAGMKAYVHRVYGAHLFEPTDEEDETTEAQEEKEEDFLEEKEEKEEDSGDGFGWWGVLQDVAEAGLFGTMKQVYQANFHEVCMWLVRKRMAERQMRAQMESKKSKHNFD